MKHDHFSIVATITRSLMSYPWRRWTGEVTDPASPIAGLIVRASSREGVRRALALEAALAGVDDRYEPLPDEVMVDVVTWQTNTYAVPIPEC